MLSAAILAGGHSSRFGSNKALSYYGGETLIARAARLLLSVCDEVVVSASRVNAPSYEFLGLEIVEDELTDCGPLGGLEALLDRCATPWLLVVTCDMPYVDSDALNMMIDEAGRMDGGGEKCLPHAVAWRRRSDDSISPFPLLVERDALTVLRQRINDGRYSVKGLLDAFETHYIYSTTDEMLCNVNRPGDLR